MFAKYINNCKAKPFNKSFIVYKQKKYNAAIIINRYISKWLKQYKNVKVLIIIDELDV